MKTVLNRRFIEDEQLLHWRQIEDKAILNIRSIEDAAVHMQADEQKTNPIRPRDAQLEDGSKRRCVVKRELLDPQERVHACFTRTRYRLLSSHTRMRRRWLSDAEQDDTSHFTSY